MSKADGAKVAAATASGPMLFSERHCRWGAPPLRLGSARARATIWVCGVPLRLDEGHAAMLHDEPQRTGDRAEHGDEHRGGQPFVVSIGGGCRRCTISPNVATANKINPGQKKLSFIAIPACGCVVRE